MKPLALTLLLVPLAAAPSLTAQERGDEEDRLRTWRSLLRRFDEDGDGQVTREEWSRRPRVYARLDRDGDGVLTEAEFVRPVTPDSSPEAPPVSEGPVLESPALDAEGLEFFETKVRPVLANACYRCHSADAERLRGGLQLDSRDALLVGGSAGAAVVPGDPDASLLIQAVRYVDEDLEMPPKERLSDEAVRDLERWVTMGAPWPEEATPESAPRFGEREIDIEEGKQWWSFRPPVKSDPPVVEDEAWAWTAIDRFLLAEMEAQGLEPVGDADRASWLRRVSFDLTGLPPTPEELAAFEADRADDAYEQVVDRLLASRGFGERWGRHWLDVARYAESSGRETNVLYPHAWRYRDWVIGAFADDLPYDELLRQQLAGDLMPADDATETAERAIATGYLALGSKSHNTRGRTQFELDVVDEQIDAISQGMLGLTVACARCHDHKFDPVPTEDYYALAGILGSSETHYGTQRGPGNRYASELLSLPAEAELPNGPRMDSGTRRVLERLRERLARVLDDAPSDRPRTRAGDAMESMDDEPRMETAAVNPARLRRARQQVAMLDDLLARFDADGDPLPANRLAMGMSEGRARDARVLERGEPDKARERVPRGFPQVLTDDATPEIRRGSGRRELADWIASPENPLTARVWVNRVWRHLFGAGIVPTPDNFGASGQPPTHPELLDWLAVTFVEEDGWSTKALVRRVVLSHAYRLAAVGDRGNERVDPEATYLWRMPERRLEAEALRDAMLYAAGTLELAPPVGSPVGVLEGQPRREEVLELLTAERPVRSVYLPILRDHVPEALEVFDAADPAFVTGDREETNTATQALYLMNDEDVLAAADAFAERLLALDGNVNQRIEAAFLLALGREPSTKERAAVKRFLKDFEELAGERYPEGRELRRMKRRGELPPEPEVQAWSAFAQSLFQCAEFRYVG